MTTAKNNHNNNNKNEQQRRQEKSFYIYYNRRSRPAAFHHVNIILYADSVAWGTHVTSKLQCCEHYMHVGKNVHAHRQTRTEWGFLRCVMGAFFRPWRLINLMVFVNGFVFLVSMKLELEWPIFITLFFFHDGKQIFPYVFTYLLH